MAQQPIDRTNDYRIICEKCGKDFGGTYAAIPGHKIHYITCQSCKYGSFENFLKEYQARLQEIENESSRDAGRTT